MNEIVYSVKISGAVYFRQNLASHGLVNSCPLLSRFGSLRPVFQDLKSPRKGSILAIDEIKNMTKQLMAIPEVDFSDSFKK